MKLINTQHKQRGFFAVGLGLALTALFGATAITIEHTARDEQVAEQPVAQAPELVYQDSDN